MGMACVQSFSSPELGYHFGGIRLNYGKDACACVQVPLAPHLCTNALAEGQ